MQSCLHKQLGAHLRMHIQKYTVSDPTDVQGTYCSAPHYRCDDNVAELWADPSGTVVAVDAGAGLHKSCSHRSHCATYSSCNNGCPTQFLAVQLPTIVPLAANDTKQVQAHSMQGRHSYKVPD